MPSNIKINDVKSLRFRCKYDEYYDFMLYRGECYGDGSFGDCLAADINAIGLPIGQVKRNEPEPGSHSSTKGGEVYSHNQWVDAINEDTTMKDIGLTGIDNGFITYRKDRISNRDFLKIYTGTTYNIPEADKTFFMSPASGNTQMYKYNMFVDKDDVGEYFAMKGGFLQGFYKLHQMDYQTLPFFIDDEWNMSFQLRRRPDYDDGDVQTLNHLHPKNAGLFFYMGTRAENKFWELYNTTEDKAEFLIPSASNDGYIEDWDPQNHMAEQLNYFEYEIINNFDDGYLVDEDSGFEGYAVDPEYWQKDIDLAEVNVLTSLGYRLDQRGYYEIETDNKFIFFNRTCTGFTVNNWDDCMDASVILEGQTANSRENKFITYNRTCTGKTVNSPDTNHFVVTGCSGGQYYSFDMGSYEPYDVFKDIKNNSFGLRITPEGAIGYKYGMLDCSEDADYPDHHFSVKEEYSKDGLIPEGEWVDVHVKFKILNPTYRYCLTGGEMKKIPNHIGERKMRIYIYVNGYLVFISKELPEFNFRALDDVYQKQEGVPFSMSLGGGTQGLLETISKDYYHISEYCLPIEANFAGTFIGDIRYFRFYDCFMDLPTIRRKRLFIG